jgi:hypothetical protein
MPQTIEINSKTSLPDAVADYRILDHSSVLSERDSSTFDDHLRRIFCIGVRHLSFCDP